jgi:hypothetical protein
MAITVKHTKVSTIPDGDDSSLIRPSDWNDDHQLTGTVPVANGGTGAATLTGYVKGNGTSNMTASSTIPNTDITGLGTMSTQNANNVAVTGGTVSGTTLTGDTVSDNLDFTPTSAPSYVEGTLWYDSTQKALAYYNDVTNNTVHIGQEVQLKVINNTGSSIANGTPVYVTGTSSGQSYPNIALAKADAVGTSAVLGLTNGTIASGAVGYVCTSGLLTPCNTGSFTVGQVLYLSPYSAGQLQNTIPPTGYAVQVGVVAYANTPNGSIYIKQTTPLAVSAATITGTVAVNQGGTGVQTITGYIKGSGTSAFTGSSTIPTTDLSGTVTNAQLANSAITINGTSTSLGGSISVGTVTSVTGTAPVASSGGATPAISLATGYGDTQNPYASKTANYFLTAPNGSAGAPTFRAMVAADVPTLNQNTTGSAATLTTGRTIAITGDLTYTSPSFDGSANVTAAGTLATVNSNVGTYTKITINGKGLATAGSQASLTDLSSPTASFSFGSQLLTNLLDPVSAQDGATKNYVDTVAQGLDAKASCVAATTASITLVGGQVIDGVTVVAGDRVLVKNQSSASANGIYVAQTTAWTRATDMDTWAEVPNAFTFVEGGTTQADTGWVCTSAQGGTIGVTAINWTQFSGAGTYTAGTGLTLTGTQFSITNVGTASTYGSATQTPVFTTNAQGQVSSVTNTTITPAVGSITGLGTGVATALAVNTGSVGAFVVNGGALGTPSSGTVTNLTGTASININGTVGATTANTGAFTTLSASSTVSGTGFSNYLASPPAIGGTTAAAITGTTITATKYVGVSGGTF